MKTYIDRNWSDRIRKINTAFLSALAAVIISVPATYADDTEIFFGKDGAGAESNPNVLFILDSSGSMRISDTSGTTRLEQVKSAMSILLDQSSDFNVGLAAFNGGKGGAAIRYPVGYLEEDLTTDCPEDRCPDQLVVGRGASLSDDAFESTDTGIVTTVTPRLPLGTLSVTTDTGNGAAAGGTEVTETSIAIASVAEAERASDGVAVHRSDEAENLWFYWGTPETHSTTRYGYRFDEVSIPRGATVTGAKITFVFSDTSRQVGNVGAYISAESSATPAPYPDETILTEPEPGTLLEFRNSTNELVAWPEIPQGVGGTSVDTVDISALLQEIISLPGWATGNSVSIHLDAFDEVAASLETTRKFFGVSADPAKVPVLTYTYIAPEQNNQNNESNSGIATLAPVTHSMEYFNPGSLEVTADASGPFANLFSLDDNHELGLLGLRFEEIGIPAGASITSATLKLHVNSAGDTGSGVAGSGGSLHGSIGDEDEETVRQFVTSINAELSTTPSAFGTQNIRDRNFTSQFIEWADVSDIAGSDDTSGDFKAVVQQVVDLADWDEHSSLMLTLNPGSAHDAELLRSVHTSTGAFPPSLEISWVSDDGADDSVSVDLLTAMRFNYMHIPPGAEITSAVINMHAHNASNTESTFTITAEDIGNSPGFETTHGNLSTRNTTTATETWIPGEWPSKNGEVDTVDVTRLVQEVIGRTDWCGGNAISLLISGTGFREVVAQEQSSVNAPTLTVFYAPETVPTGSYCSNRNSIATIRTGEDDVYEDNQGNIERTEASLELIDTGDGQVGLRFQNVNLDPGAVVKQATLEITAATDFSESVGIKIEIEDTENAEAFKTGKRNLSNRTFFSNSVNWTDMPAVPANESIFSPDISNLLSHVVNKPGWEKSNSAMLRLTSLSDSGSYPIYSREGNEALRANLIVYYETTRVTPGSLLRDNLKEEVNSIVASGATPIVSALYEAAQYFSGDAVDYGLKRGRNFQRNARFLRVSHPESYDGGHVHRLNGCTDRNLNSIRCVQERIDNNPVYRSPISNRCQQSHIVLLSDGAPTTNTAAAKIRDKTGLASCSYPDSDPRACGTELTEWLNNTDLSYDIPGQQEVRTHTIAFNLAETQFLENLATTGGGGHYKAGTTSELLHAFKSIFVNVSKSDTSFVAPSVSVDQFNRLKHREDIYFAQFKPSSTARWDGNLKKYKVQGEEGEAVTILDSNDAEAINEVTGQFNPNTTSFWSSTQDGGDVGSGGAASKLNFQARNIYTYTGSDNDLTAASNEIATNNEALDIELFNLPPEQATNVQYIADLVNWVAGHDSRDENANGDLTEYRQHIGDPMHSQPLALSYATDSETDTKTVIYIGTNEGYLHAVDNLTGLEHFSFIPPELLKNMAKFFDNEPQSNRIYGLDGSITAWIDDKNSNGLIDSNETALLYVGMRRGGENYYVLDISDYENPSLAYVIKGRTNTLEDLDDQTATGDYTELSQTWSKIVKTKIRDGSATKDVIIFAGGYDPNQDPANAEDTTDEVNNEFGADANRIIDGVGRAIFIADALTGELIWTTSLSDPDFSQMNYSIPTDLRVIDINSDGLVDQVYFGDMGGQIWRMDINNREDISNPISSRIRAGVIAELGDDSPENSIRFYYPPDVALVNFNGRQQLSVSVGSGWRAHPLQTRVNDRFYSFRLDDVFTAPVDSFGQIRYPKITETSNHLLDVTDHLNSDMVGYKGWFINLEGNGEKALSSSTTIDNKVVFTSYTPAHNTEVCAAAVGNGAAYVVDVFNGDPVVDLKSDGSSDVDPTTLTKKNRKQFLKNPGIPTTPNVVFPSTGDPSVLVGPETLDSVKIENLKRTSFWQEHVDDNS